MHVSFAEGILIAIAIGQLVYASLTFHHDRAAAATQNGTRKRPLLIVASMMVLTWAGVGFDIYSRSRSTKATFINYGVDGPKQFHGIVQLSNWDDYKDQKAILITRTMFGDRDRLTDDWIAKSVPYTIEGPVVSMVSITENQMHFSLGALNYVEYNFVVLPAEISTSQIRNLGDVSRLGGKILATSAQGIPVAAQESPNQLQLAK